MKKILFILCTFFFLTKAQSSTDYKKVYFAGGCFWCMEEAYDEFDGVISSISGYSGGKLKNPKYEDVVYKDTGHVEAVEITYDPNKITYERLLDIFWINIDPFDAKGQFCDKGYSYRSVAFYKTNDEKIEIKESIKEIEKKFNKEVLTYLIEFDKFYEAEKYHQNYYQENFVNYLLYKKGCGREKKLDSIWNE